MLRLVSVRAGSGSKAAGLAPAGYRQILIKNQPPPGYRAADKLIV
jgi:hypothetical protein